MRLVKILALFALLAGISGFALWAWFSMIPLSLSQPRIEFRIPPGSSLRHAAQIIEAAGVKLPATVLSGLGRVVRRAEQIKAGSYEIHEGITARGLLDTLTQGDVSQTAVVLVDGKSFRQFRQLLDHHPELRHDTTRLSDSELLQRLGAQVAHPEGLFFPDTYRLDKGGSDFDVMRRAYQAMQTRLAEAWAARDPQLPLKSPYELLILASIVEKESAREADRTQIASVFINRLRRAMRLQTDPTVIYGLGEGFNGNLRKADLLRDTPWNTYTRHGLPPTPIAMPGAAALWATSRPATSDALYFVARGDGSSQFSATLDAHNRAVNRFQRGN